MALVLNGSGTITGVTDLATAGVALEDAALTDPVVTGGIYLGGTGAANYLDDYEEGTWTPVFYAVTTDFTSVTYNGSQHYAEYIKIGDMVTVFMQTRTDAISGGSGSVRISGLPFATAPAEAGTGGGAAPWMQNWNSNFSIGCYPSGTNILLFKNGANATPVTVGDMRTTNDSNQTIVSFSYRV